jgi:chromosome partitioning protein
LAQPARSDERQSAAAHVIVLGNEKGGSGKSTVALHIAVALLKAGQRVATIDLDARQRSLTRFITNRGAWAAHTGLNLELPTHRCIEFGQTMQIADNENRECQQFIDAVASLDRRVDFLVIDTPGTDSYLSRLAHSIADTLVTPLNDSLLDFDVLGIVDPATYAVIGVAHYAAMVRDARRSRRQLDGSTTEWIVMRNRLSMLASRNTQAVGDRLRELSRELGFRPIDGLVERSIYREFLLRGITALDDIDQAELRMRQPPGQIAARAEVKRLLEHLKLPLHERGRRRAANRAVWFDEVGKPLEADELLGA